MITLKKRKDIRDYFSDHPKVATASSFALIILICLGWQMTNHETEPILGTLLMAAGIMIFIWVFLPVIFVINYEKAFDYINRHPILHIVATAFAVASIIFSPSLQLIRSAISDYIPLMILLILAYLGLMAGYLHQIKTRKNVYEAFMDRMRQKNKFLYSLLIIGTFLWAGLFLAGIGFIVLIDIVGLFQLVYAGVGLFF